MISVELKSFHPPKEVEALLQKKMGYPCYASEEFSIWEGSNISIRFNKNKSDSNSAFDASLNISVLRNSYIDSSAFKLLQKFNVYKKQNKFDSAFFAIDSYLEIYPNSANAFQLRGILKTNRKIKDYIGAVQDFTNAIVRDSKNGSYFLLRGMTYRVMGRESEACSDIRKAMALGDQDASKFVKDCPEIKRKTGVKQSSHPPS